MARDKAFLAALLCVAVILETAATERSGAPRHGAVRSLSIRVGRGAGDQGEHGRRIVRVMLRSRVIGLFHSAGVIVSGTTARGVEVRLSGATDSAGLAYEWTPYRWRRLRLLHGAWRGVLPAPALLGIYQLQLRLDSGRRLLSSTRWLLRVFRHGTVSRPSFPTAGSAVRSYVAHLPGDQVLVALRRWPQAGFDRRDRRLHRLFVIAYAPRGDNRLSSRLGLFITTVRDGFHGRWRLLRATTQPYE
jgi:hypothetical protein